MQDFFHQQYHNTAVPWILWGIHGHLVNHAKLPRIGHIQLLHDLGMPNFPNPLEAPYLENIGKCAAFFFYGKTGWLFLGVSSWWKQTSWELTHPPQKIRLKMIFLFPVLVGRVIVPWRVNITYGWAMSFSTQMTHQTFLQHGCFQK